MNPTGHLRTSKEGGSQPPPTTDAYMRADHLLQYKEQLNDIDINLEDFDSDDEMTIESDHSQEADHGDSVSIHSYQEVHGVSSNIKQSRVSPKAAATSKLSSEKVISAKEKNRVHAKKTRQRKKDYVESLRETLQQLSEEKERIERERRVMTARLLETASVRKRVLREVLIQRATGNLDKLFWASVLDDSFTMVLPITPYRSFPPSEVKDGERRLVGINAMLMDTASINVMFQTLKPAVNEDIKVNVTCVCDLSSAILTQELIMSRWELTTTNAVSAGCMNEVVVHGMLKASFSVTNKLVYLELIFDVMSLMQQLRRASHRTDFTIIPNTYQLALERVPGARIITDSVAPYPVIYVSPGWEDMFGYTSHEIVGQSCKLLQGPLTEQDKIEKMMRYVRACLPCSTVVTNYHKNGDPIRNWIKIYPLFADNAVRYFIGVMERVPEHVAFVPTVISPKNINTFPSAAPRSAAEFITSSSANDTSSVNSKTSRQHSPPYSTAINPYHNQVPNPSQDTSKIIVPSSVIQPLSAAENSNLNSMSGISRAFRLAQLKKEAAAAASVAGVSSSTNNSSSIGTTNSQAKSETRYSQQPHQQELGHTHKGNNNSGDASNSSYHYGTNTFSRPKANVLYPPEVLSSLPRFPIVGLPPHPYISSTAISYHEQQQNQVHQQQQQARQASLSVSHSSNSTQSKKGSDSQGSGSINSIKSTPKDTSTTEDSALTTSSSSAGRNHYHTNSSRSSGSGHDSMEFNAFANNNGHHSDRRTTVPRQLPSSSTTSSSATASQQVITSGSGNTTSVSDSSNSRKRPRTPSTNPVMDDNEQEISRRKVQYTTSSVPIADNSQQDMFMDASDEYLYGILNELDGNDYSTSNNMNSGNTQEYIFDSKTNNGVANHTHDMKNHHSNNNEHKLPRQELWDSTHHGSIQPAPVEHQQQIRSNHQSSHTKAGTLPMSTSDSYSMGLSGTEEGPDHPAPNTIINNKSSSQTEFSIPSGAFMINNGNSTTDFTHVFSNNAMTMAQQQLQGEVSNNADSGHGVMTFDRAMLEMDRQQQQRNDECMFESFSTQILDQQRRQQQIQQQSQKQSQVPQASAIYHTNSSHKSRRSSQK